MPFGGRREQRRCDVDGEYCRFPIACPRDRWCRTWDRAIPPPAPSRARYPLTLGALAGMVNVPLDLWLRPNGVGYVLIALASCILALATGTAEQVIPVPRATTEQEASSDEPADG